MLEATLPKDQHRVRGMCNAYVLTGVASQKRLGGGDWDKEHAKLAKILKDLLTSYIMGVPCPMDTLATARTLVVRQLPLTSTSATVPKNSPPAVADGGQRRASFQRARSLETKRAPRHAFGQ